jgi:hypothetical protein
MTYRNVLEFWDADFRNRVLQSAGQAHRHAHNATDPDEIRAWNVAAAQLERIARIPLEPEPVSDGTDPFPMIG